MKFIEYTYPSFFHKYHLPELFTVPERCMSGKLFVSYWNSSRSKKAIDSSFSFSKVLCTTVKIRWPYACKKVPWATMKPKKKRSRVLTFLQHWPFQPFFGRRNSSLEQLLKYRALQKTKWRDSSALIILPTRRQVHQVFRRVASAAEKTRDFTLLFLLFFDPFLLHQKHKSWPINNWSNFFFTFCTAKIAFDCGDRVHFLQDYHQHEIPRDKAKQTGNESQKSSKNHNEFRAC